MIILVVGSNKLHRVCHPGDVSLRMGEHGVSCSRAGDPWCEESWCHSAKNKGKSLPINCI